MAAILRSVSVYAEEDLGMGAGRGVATKFCLGDGFIGTETHLPPKFSLPSDFGHFILTMVEMQNFHMCQKRY